MSSLLMFYRVFRLEIQSGMFVFSTGFVNYCPFIFSLVRLRSPSPFIWRRKSLVFYKSFNTLWHELSGPTWACGPCGAACTVGWGRGSAQLWWWAQSQPLPQNPVCTPPEKISVKFFFIELFMTGLFFCTTAFRSSQDSSEKIRPLVKKSKKLQCINFFMAC